jgi:hypothetical protein
MVCNGPRFAILVIALYKVGIAFQDTNEKCSDETSLIQVKQVVERRSLGTLDVLRLASDQSPTSESMSYLQEMAETLAEADEAMEDTKEDQSLNRSELLTNDTNQEDIELSEGFSVNESLSRSLSELEVNESLNRSMSELEVNESLSRSAGNETMLPNLPGIPTAPIQQFMKQLAMFTPTTNAPMGAMASNVAKAAMKFTPTTPSPKQIINFLFPTSTGPPTTTPYPPDLTSTTSFDIITDVLIPMAVANEIGQAANQQNQYEQQQAQVKEQRTEHEEAMKYMEKMQRAQLKEQAERAGRLRPGEHIPNFRHDWKEEDRINAGRRRKYPGYHNSRGLAKDFRNGAKRRWKKMRHFKRKMGYKQGKDGRIGVKVPIPMPEFQNPGSPGGVAAGSPKAESAANYAGREGALPQQIVAGAEAEKQRIGETLVPGKAVDMGRWAFSGWDDMISRAEKAAKSAARNVGAAMGEAVGARNAAVMNGPLQQMAAARENSPLKDLNPGGIAAKFNDASKELQEDQDDMDEAQQHLEAERNREINEQAVHLREQEQTKDMEARMAAERSAAESLIQQESHPDLKSSSGDAKAASKAHGRKHDPLSFLDGLLGKTKAKTAGSLSWLTAFHKTEQNASAKAQPQLAVTKATQEESNKATKAAEAKEETTKATTASNDATKATAISIVNKTGTEAVSAETVKVPSAISVDPIKPIETSATEKRTSDAVPTTGTALKEAGSASSERARIPAIPSEPEKARTASLISMATSTEVGEAHAAAARENSTAAVVKASANNKKKPSSQPLSFLDRLLWRSPGSSPAKQAMKILPIDEKLESKVAQQNELPWLQRLIQKR